MLCLEIDIIVTSVHCKPGTYPTMLCRFLDHDLGARLHRHRYVDQWGWRNKSKFLLVLLNSAVFFQTWQRIPFLNQTKRSYCGFEHWVCVAKSFQSIFWVKQSLRKTLQRRLQYFVFILKVPSFYLCCDFAGRRVFLWHVMHRKKTCLIWQLYFLVIAEMPSLLAEKTRARCWIRRHLRLHSWTGGWSIMEEQSIFGN